MKELKELAKQYQGTGDVEVRAQKKDTERIDCDSKADRQS